MEKKKMALSNAIILTAILSVLTIALQIAGYFAVQSNPYIIALSLVPICLGAFYGGPYIGMILGGVFAITSLFLPSTWELFEVDAFATLVIFLAKGILVGYLTGLAFAFLTRVNKIFASFIGATACSLVNTLVYLVGAVIFLSDNLSALGGRGTGLKASLDWFWSGISEGFIFEFALTIFIAPLVYLGIEYIRHMIRKKYMKNKKHHHGRRPHYIEKTDVMK